MHQLIKVGIAAFIGKVLATLFIAICIVIGFGPPEWAAYVLHGSSYVTPEMLRVSLIIVGGIAVAFAYGPQINRRPWPSWLMRWVPDWLRLVLFLIAVGAIGIFAHTALREYEAQALLQQQDAAREAGKVRRTEEPRR